jgi:LmbE family N-acetylglucosaminyl deacetylase
MMQRNKRILIVVSHFDDDVISFGGLMNRERMIHNHEVYVHVFTAGGPCSNVSGDIRIDEFKSVMALYNIDEDHYSYSGVGLDGRLDSIPNCEITSKIDKLVSEIEPDEVYCSADSEHSDHQALAKAFRGAARLKSGWQPKLWAFGTYMFSNQLPVPMVGGYMFQPLSDEDFKAKCDAFKLYASQFKPSPSPLGIDGLEVMARYYGMLCGHKYAEAYYQLKYIREI